MPNNKDKVIPLSLKDVVENPHKYSEEVRKKAMEKVFNNAEKLMDKIDEKENSLSSKTNKTINEKELNDVRSKIKNLK